MIFTSLVDWQSRMLKIIWKMLNSTLKSKHTLFNERLLQAIPFMILTLTAKIISCFYTSTMKMFGIWPRELCLWIQKVSNNHMYPIFGFFSNAKTLTELHIDRTYKKPQNCKYQDCKYFIEMKSIDSVWIQFRIYFQMRDFIQIGLNQNPETVSQTFCFTAIAFCNSIFCR